MPLAPGLLKLGFIDSTPPRITRILVRAIRGGVFLLRHSSPGQIAPGGYRCPGPFEPGLPDFQPRDPLLELADLDQLALDASEAQRISSRTFKTRPPLRAHDRGRIRPCRQTLHAERLQLKRVQGTGREVVD